MHQRILLLLLSLLLLNGCGPDFIRHEKTSAEIKEIKRANDLKNISPSSNHAILTLDNGASLIIDSSDTGLLAHQGHTIISKSAGDCLTYTMENSDLSGIAYNTLTTPRGGRFRLVLPDGTRVWLNDTSSITFPSAFSGTQRLVMISGEVYFEVFSNASMPFVVKTRDQVVENLGTAFNIKAYPKENVIITTPIQGPAKVFLNTNVILLYPGQQGLSYGQSLVIKDSVVTENTVAWHEGFFVFNGNSLTDIMGQIGRRYNLQIKYEGSFSPQKFDGRISSQLNLYEVLRLLEEQGVRFELEGKLLHVSQVGIR